VYLHENKTVDTDSSRHSQERQNIREHFLVQWLYSENVDLNLTEGRLLQPLAPLLFSQSPYPRDVERALPHFSWLPVFPLSLCSWRLGRTSLL